MRTRGRGEEGAMAAIAPNSIPRLDGEAALFQLPLLDLPLHARLLLDDAAVEQVDGAVGVAGEARVVGDHADRGAVLVQLLQQLHDRFAVARVEVAVGSSASRIDGLPTTARATATRC